MGKKRPYSNSVKNRYNSNYNRNSRYTAKKNETSTKEKKSFENTMRIRVDKDRLNDFESLDTSFLEGRRKKNPLKEKKHDKKNKKEIFKVSTIVKLRNICFLLGILSLLVLVTLIFLNNHLFAKNDIVSTKKNIDIEEKNNMIDTNCLFIGNFYTKEFSLKDIGFSLPYVNNSEEKFFTTDVLDSMKKNIYDYNPSIIFFELGIADYLDGKDDSEILNNIGNIITMTKENRPYAEIYIESFYPINKDIDDYNDDLFRGKDNKDLMGFNEKLKDLCKSYSVHYVDVFSELSVDDKLKENYTDDGVHLNQDGYKRLFKIIRKIVGSN